MSWRLIVRPEADRDLSEAYEWYEAQVPGLGAQFVEEFESTLDSVQQFPEKHAVIYRAVRRLLTHRFPYLVFYAIHGETISVLGVLHASRDPQSWRRRVRSLTRR